MLKTIFMSAAFALATSTAFAADLLAEVQAGRVQVVSMTGNGSSSGAALEGVLRNTTGAEVLLDVHLQSPVYFDNSGPAQDMLATQVYMGDGGYMTEGSRSFIEMAPGAAIPVLLVAYCADFDLDNPGSDSRFSVSAMPAGLEAAARRISSYEAANAGVDLTAAAQVALWLAQGETPEEIAEKFDFTADDLRIAQTMAR